MKKIFFIVITSLVFTTANAFDHPEPARNISLESITCELNHVIFNRQMNEIQANGGIGAPLNVVTEEITGKIGYFFSGHQSTVVGYADVRNEDSVHPGNTYTLYKPRLNVSSIISLEGDPETYYGIRLSTGNNDCALNSQSRVNLLQSAYENDQGVRIKYVRIAPFDAVIGLDEDGYFDTGFDLKYGYITEVEITDLPFWYNNWPLIAGLIAAGMAGFYVGRPKNK